MAKFICIPFLFLFSSTSFAQIKVVTTLPDIAEIVREVGGDLVSVQSLLEGSEDAHFAEARPDYILKVSRADMLCSMGLELEVGWLPKVISRSGNSKIQEGTEGDCVLGRAVSQPLEVPQGVLTREMGDVHPHGNPHFNLDPLRLAEASKEVLRVLILQLPSSKEVLKKNQEKFVARMTALHEKIKGLLKGVKVMEYHREFFYFFDTYKIESLGSLEEKPGMLPSAARIATVAQMAKEKKVKVLLANPSAPHRTLEKFSELSGVPSKNVPSHVQTKGPASSIEALQMMLAEALK